MNKIVPENIRVSFGHVIVSFVDSSHYYLIIVNNCNSTYREGVSSRSTRLFIPTVKKFKLLVFNVNVGVEFEP